jgi:hypothetical protein
MLSDDAAEETHERLRSSGLVRLLEMKGAQKSMFRVCGLEGRLQMILVVSADALRRTRPRVHGGPESG